MLVYQKVFKFARSKSARGWFSLEARVCPLLVARAPEQRTTAGSDQSEALGTSTWQLDKKIQSAMNQSAMPAMSKILPNKSIFHGRPQQIYKFSIEKQSWSASLGDWRVHRIACVHHFMIMASFSNFRNEKDFVQRINIPSAQTQLNFIIHRFHSHIKHKYI